MKKSEKIFTLIVLCLSAFLTVGALKTFFIDIPKGTFPADFYLISLWMILLAATYGSTSIINLKHGKLLTTPSIIQIVALFLYMPGIVLAIWGIVLMRKQKTANQRLEAIVKTPVDSGKAQGTQPHP
jgi:hypothetical protein